ARGVPCPTHLDLDRLRTDQNRLMPPLAARTADADLGVALDPVRRLPRQVERPRHAGEHVCAAAELPRLAARLDATSSAEHDERNFELSGLPREDAASDAEVEMPPAGRFGRHAVPRARPEQQLAHATAAVSSSSVGIASEQARRDATS